MQSTIEKGVLTPCAQLSKIAKKFSNDRRIFLPCFGEKIHGKKIPCKGSTQDLFYTWDDLSDFPSMQILSISLDVLIAIDMDGKQAHTLIDKLINANGELPETLYVTSDPFGDTRGAYIFKIPESYLGILKSYTHEFKSDPGVKSDKLEFRTGSKSYQAIAGIHPLREYYYSDNIGNFNFDQIPYLPDIWCDYIVNVDKVRVNREADKAANTTSKMQSIQMVLEMLASVDCPKVSVDNYDTWVRIGMIYHQIDDGSDEAFETWVKWSSTGFNVATDQEFQSKWNSFNDRGSTISIGSLFYWFKQEVSGGNIDPDKLSQINLAIDSAKDLLSDIPKMEDRVKILQEFRDLGLEGLALEDAIYKLAQDLWGTKSPHKDIVETLTEMFYKENITPEQQDAYNAICLKAIEDVHSDVSDIMKGIYIIDTIKSYFFDQGIGDFYFHGLMSFITAASSIQAKGLELQFNQQERTAPIVYTVLIARPAWGKDAIISSFTKPLIKMTSQQANKAVDIEKELDVERDYFMKLPSSKDKESVYLSWLMANNLDATAKSGSFNAAKAMNEMFPAMPAPRVYALLDYTVESGRSISGEQDGSGSLICASEFSNLLGKQSKYGGKSGKADLTELILGFDAGETLTNRVGGANASNSSRRKSDAYQFSLLTTIQPDVFDENFSLSDGNGFLSRCNLLPFHRSIEYKTNDDPDSPDVLDIRPLITEFYEKTISDTAHITRENPYLVRYTKEAKQIWNVFAADCNKRSENVPDTGFFAYLRRCPVKVARIIFALHMIKYVCGDVKELDRITANTVIDGIKLMNILIQYGEKVYGVSSDIDQDLVDPVKVMVFQKVVKLAKKRGNVLPLSVLCNQSWKKNPEIVQAFNKTRKYMTSLGQLEMIHVCEQATLYGLGVWNPNNKTFTIK